MWRDVRGAPRNFWRDFSAAIRVPRCPFDPALISAELKREPATDSCLGGGGGKYQSININVFNEYSSGEKIYICKQNTGEIRTVIA